MMFKKIFYLLPVLILVSIFTSITDAREWKLGSGRKIYGEYIKTLNNGKLVVIRLQSSGIFTRFVVRALSEDDQKYIDEQIKSNAAANPNASDLVVESDESFIVVEVTGTGSTIEDAKKDALKNALGLAVGTLVDSETIISDEGVFEKIMTGSNSFIKEHVVLAEKQEGGLWKTSIRATVLKREVNNKLLPNLKESRREVDGADTVRKLELMAERKEINLENEAAVVGILAKAIKDQNFPFSCLDATVLHDPVPTQVAGQNITIRVNLAVTFNKDKFDAFHKAIYPVIKKIMIRQRGGINIPGISYISNDNEKVIALSEFPPNRTSNTVLWVNETRNKSWMTSKWIAYELPRKTSLVFRAYGAVVPVFEITLYDKEGNDIISERVGIPRATLTPYSYCHSNEYSKDNPFAFGSTMLISTRSYHRSWDDRWHELNDDWRSRTIKTHYLAPICATDTGVKRNPFRVLTIWPIWRQAVEFNLTRAQLASLKTVGCVLLPECPELDEFHENLEKYVTEAP